MRVILDTNVIVSALRSAEGASFRLIALVRAGKLQPAVTAPLAFEYQDVVSRRGLLPHLTPRELDAFLDWFVSVSSHHNVHFLWRPLLNDPQDDMVLEAAVSAAADFLVTHNVRDFRGGIGFGFRVVTPGALLRQLSVSQSP
ncbi:MAG: hypothetical protein RLZZ15_2024 [Verrucomicrobiota bacterium]